VLSQADDALLDAIDRRLSVFTAQADAFELMVRLQARGIAAGVVQDMEELCERDPQLEAREALVMLDHARLGRFGHQVAPYRLSRTPSRMSPAPGLGQHTESICREILAMSQASFEALKADGLFV
jgi:benzylsuccinate CoA-transferase BbsF subunit